MSRRSRQRRKVLGRPNAVYMIGSVRREIAGTGCRGDEGKAHATRPSSKVLGTGKWLSAGMGKGATVTLPQKKP